MKDELEMDELLEKVVDYFTPTELIDFLEGLDVISTRDLAILLREDLEEIVPQLCEEMNIDYEDGND